MTRAALISIALLFLAGVAFCLFFHPREGVVTRSLRKWDREVSSPSISVSRTIVKTLRLIKKGEQFDRDSVEEVSVSSANEDYLAADYAYASYMVLGRRAARDLPAGSWLSENDCFDTDEDMR